VVKVKEENPMTKIIKILTKIAENQQKTTGLSKETSDSDVS
jgi:hypothetical protein